MARRYRYITTDVFTDTLFHGNPLAVFPDARGIDDPDMQRIAREFNLAETTFVLPPADPRHSFSLRIFTPGAELPFAGHPTVGTAVAMAEAGLLPPGSDRIVIEERVGPVPVVIGRSADGVSQAEFSLPKLPERVGDLPEPGELASLLGLPTDGIAAGVLPGIYSAGVPFACIPVRDAAALGAARLNGDAWAQQVQGSKAAFVVTMADWKTGREIRARMFAPGIGIPEDPATGGAAAAMAGFLAELQKPADGAHDWLIRQGEEMGRPSRIHLGGDFAGGRLTAARIGGQAVVVSEGEILLR